MNRKQHAPRRWISSAIFLCKEEHVIAESRHAHCRRNPLAMPLKLGRAGSNSSPPEIKLWRSRLHTEGRGVHRRFFTLPLEPGCVWRFPPSGLPHSLLPTLSGLLGMLPSISPAPFLFFFLLMIVFIWFSLERAVEALVFQILLDKGKSPLPDHPQSETNTSSSMSSCSFEAPNWMFVPRMHADCVTQLAGGRVREGCGEGYLLGPGQQVREDATKGFNCKFSKWVLKHNFNNESTLLPIYRITWMTYFCDLKSFFFAF